MLLKISPINNPQLSALLIDDENLAIANLSSMIGSYCPSLKIIGSAPNVTDAALKVNTLKPDVIFLDVNMPKQNGFELLNQLTHIPSVVFVTAHEKYALQAMKVCAVDFLLKPISIDELKLAQTKLLQIHALKPEIRKNYNQVLRNLSAIMDKPGSINKITLYGNKGYEIFDIEEILYLSGDDNYTTFHFLKHPLVMVTKTLKDYEEILEPMGFMRIHKSTLVNQFHIKKLIQNEGAEVLLSDGKLLNVSRRRLVNVLEWIKQQAL